MAMLVPADARVAVTGLPSLLRAAEPTPLNRIPTEREGRGIAAIVGATSEVDTDDGRGVRDAADPGVPATLYGPHREVFTELVQPLQ